MPDRPIRACDRSCPGATLLDLTLYGCNHGCGVGGNPRQSSAVFGSLRAVVADPTLEITAGIVGLPKESFTQGGRSVVKCPSLIRILRTMKLYHCKNARSLRPLWALEELGLDYE